MTRIITQFQMGNALDPVCQRVQIQQEQVSRSLRVLQQTNHLCHGISLSIFPGLGMIAGVKIFYSFLEQAKLLWLLKLQEGP
jgi:hypothetical protein